MNSFAVFFMTVSSKILDVNYAIRWCSKSLVLESIRLKAVWPCISKIGSRFLIVVSFLLKWHGIGLLLANIIVFSSYEVPGS